MNANAPTFVPSVGTPSPTLDASKLPTPLRDKSSRSPKQQPPRPSRQHPPRPPKQQQTKQQQRTQAYARQPHAQSSRHVEQQVK